MKHENEKKATATRENDYSFEILDQDFCEKELSTPAFRVLFICEREDFANNPPCTQFTPLIHL